MLNQENTGLIVVDIQGKLARLVDNSEMMIANCEKLIQGAKLLGLPIIWLEQNPEKLGPTVEELGEHLTGNEPISKYTFNACAEANFIKAIEQSGKQSWLVCGIEAHICVYQTSSQLKKLGYDVHLVTDCITSRDPVNKALAIEKMSSSGIEITGLEMCLYELVKDCRAKEFKGILNLIR